MGVDGLAPGTKQEQHAMGLEKKGGWVVVNAMMDGPVDFSIDGDRVVVRGTSDGERVTVTLRLADALISAHRFEKTYENRTSGDVVQVDFRARHADTA
jgi:hypothetical protein